LFKNSRSRYENNSYNQSKKGDRKYYKFKECKKEMIAGALVFIGGEVE